MAIDSYISKLVANTNRVNIPDFGALIKNTTDGTNDVSFNQYLNFDDNVLSNEVAQGEGISQAEALKLINQYVAQLKAGIENGTVSISGVGSFSKDKHIILFTPDANAVSSELPEAEAASEAVSAEEPEPENEPQNQNANEANQPEPAPSYSYTYSDDEDNRKRNILWVILIVLLFLIGAFLCLFVFNKDNAVYNLFFGEKEVIEVVDEPQAQPDTTAVETPVVEPVAEQNPLVEEKARYRYNIVVGAYNEEAQAIERVTGLQGRNFENAYVLKRKIKGNIKFLAVIDGSNNIRKAESIQENIVDKYRIESWMTNSGE